MMAAPSLSDDNQLQVESFLRFAKFKREQHVKEILSTVEDFEGYRVQSGEVYSTPEVHGLLSDLTTELTLMVQKELKNAYHTNALLVQLLLAQAQAAGIDLVVDTNQLENEYLINQLKSLEDLAVSKPASQFVRRAGQLQKMGTVATVTVADPQVVKERDQCKEDLEVLKERFAKLQQQTTIMMREKSALSDELTETKQQLALRDQRKQAGEQQQARAEADKLGDARIEQDAAAQRKMESLQHELGQASQQLQQSKSDVLALQGKLQEALSKVHKAEDALGSKLTDNKQFQAMKKMMQAKGQEVASLRRRLAKYEPQDIPQADDSQPAAEFDD